MPRVHTFRVLDRNYPAALRDLPSPPDPLCVRGELLPAPSIAIVGTRKPSWEAKAYAHGLAFRLARRGVAIWSGGAVGIDAEAHRGALDAGGLTVAVVGTGLEHCYPTKHAELYEQIVSSGGAIVSPFEPSQHATLTTFPQRNGPLAALTLATVVIQAPLKSGARSTAAFARRLRRPLFVVPAAPWDPLGAGNLAELDLGAEVLTDESRLFRLLGIRSGPPSEASAPAASDLVPPIPEALAMCPEALWDHLSPSHRKVFLAIHSVPRHLDDLCAATGLSAPLVQDALLTLTLDAVLVEGPAGWFRRASVRKY
jgi:DNA processing protein